MPTASDELVSVLMPAFKAAHFEETLRSVAAQTHERLEILVGDNSGDGAIERIAQSIGDPRVTCIPTHRVTAGSARANHMILWLRASGRRVRFVYDDDRIHPRSTAALLELMNATEGCALAWHQRELIDGKGRVTARHGVLPEDRRVVLDRALLLDNMAKFLNFVGEPSFMMLDRERIAHFDFNRYAGFDLAFLWDIAMMLAATDGGALAAGSGEFLGGFRLHAGQVSASANVFGAVEWELVFREELRHGKLSIEQFHAVLPKLLGLYESGKRHCAELAAFQSRLLEDAKAGRLAETTPLFRAEYRRLRDGFGRPAVAPLAEAA